MTRNDAGSLQLIGNLVMSFLLLAFLALIYPAMVDMMIASASYGNTTAINPELAAVLDISKTVSRALPILAGLILIVTLFAGLTSRHPTGDPTPHPTTSVQQAQPVQPVEARPEPVANETATTISREEFRDIVRNAQSPDDAFNRLATREQLRREEQERRHEQYVNSELFTPKNHLKSRWKAIDIEEKDDE